MRKSILLLFICLTLSSPAAMAEKSSGSAVPPVPTQGMITMVDLGAHKCIPCKMMTPIIKKLTKEYKGRASIIFIDVWQHRDQAAKYHIRAIPTQIFYDKNGKEVSRHVGFMGEKSIIAIFDKLGVEKNAQ